jgi:hypothetical protein
MIVHVYKFSPTRKLINKSQTTLPFHEHKCARIDNGRLTYTHANKIF